MSALFLCRFPITSLCSTSLIFLQLMNSHELLQIQGKYYLRIDPLGEGAKWRRSYGQEIYSPLLLAFTEQVAGRSWIDLASHWASRWTLNDGAHFLQDGDKWTNFQVPTFSFMDPSYSLPDNIAMLTLQVHMWTIKLHLNFFFRWLE